MRTRGRTDANQQDVARYLRSLGMSVHIASGSGGGFPDLVVGFRGVTCLLEVKDGAKVESKRVLTAAQEAWHATWAGHVQVCESKEAAAEEVIQHAKRMGVKV